eukprot:6262696-Lingulodinium_polyedra.AAC.1
MNHMRRILKLRRAPEESRKEYMHRSSLRICSACGRSEVHRLHQVLLQRQYKWIWSAMNMSWHQDGMQVWPLRELLMTRLKTVWPFTQPLGLAVDFDNHSGWRHRLSGHRSAWEADIITMMGPEWH